MYHTPILRLICVNIIFSWPFPALVTAVTARGAGGRVGGAEGEFLRAPRPTYPSTPLTLGLYNPQQHPDSGVTLHLSPTPGQVLHLEREYKKKP